MDVVSMKQRIEEKINLLEILRGQIEQLGNTKAKAYCDYKKALAEQITILRAGGTSISIIRELADGDCYNEMLACQIAENGYKGLIVQIETIQAEMNGLQSINRHIN